MLLNTQYSGHCVPTQGAECGRNWTRLRRLVTQRPFSTESCRPTRVHC